MGLYQQSTPRFAPNGGRMCAPKSQVRDTVNGHPLGRPVVPLGHGVRQRGFSIDVVLRTGYVVSILNQLKTNREELTLV